MTRRERLRGTGVLFLGPFIALSLPRPAYAQSPSSSPAAVTAAHSASSVDLTDAGALLRAAVPRTLRNRRESMAFTYEISYRNRNYSSGGKLIANYTAKYDVIFVGGLPYRRLIEENQKPLSSREAAAEQRRYDQ